MRHRGQDERNAFVRRRNTTGGIHESSSAAVGGGRPRDPASQPRQHSIVGSSDRLIRSRIDRADADTGRPLSRAVGSSTTRHPVQNTTPSAPCPGMARRTSGGLDKAFRLPGTSSDLCGHRGPSRSAPRRLAASRSRSVWSACADRIICPQRPPPHIPPPPRRRVAPANHVGAGFVWCPPTIISGALPELALDFPYR